MQRRCPLPFLLLALVLAFILAGCDQTSEDIALAPPQTITDGDACHVCGMTISSFPGPKGQAFLAGRSDALKFCSTMDLFAFLKQPENETLASFAYVHDIGKTTWQAPADDAYIRAGDAWYVVGHDQRGAMGHTLASFAEQTDAEAFREGHGGELVTYTEIDLDLLGRLGRGEIGEGMGGMHGQGEGVDETPGQE
jgi:copper chaperone NosL